MNFLWIAAIDPGPETHGLCLACFAEDGQHRFAFLNSVTTAQVKTEICDWRAEGVVCCSPLQFVIAVEHIQCFGNAVGTSVFETAYNVGAFREWAHNEFNGGRGVGFTWMPVFRMEEKMTICHSPNAKDTNIRTALIDFYGVVGTKKHQGPLYGCSGHAWSALAIAHTARMKIEEQQKKNA